MDSFIGYEEWKNECGNTQLSYIPIPCRLGFSKIRGIWGSLFGNSLFYSHLNHGRVCKMVTLVQISLGGLSKQLALSGVINGLREYTGSLLRCMKSHGILGSHKVHPELCDPLKFECRLQCLL